MLFFSPVNIFKYCPPPFVFGVNLSETHICVARVVSIGSRRQFQVSLLPSRVCDVLSDHCGTVYTGTFRDPLGNVVHHAWLSLSAPTLNSAVGAHPVHKGCRSLSGCESTECGW